MNLILVSSGDEQRVSNKDLEWTTDIHKFKYFYLFILYFKRFKYLSIGIL